MRILLLRPPRYVWPFNSETSAFWQPLGLLCLAAAARREVPDADIQVWDAPAEKTGWQTLERRLAETPIDVLGIGEETVSVHEALRAARLVKRYYPDCLVVAGGTYFAHTIESSLNEDSIDVIVRGEGEQTWVELLRHYDNWSLWPSIAGLAFRGDHNQTVMTPVRPVIKDLDTLPFPAYDLINMNSYGYRSHNHPGLVSIEHSRGCIDTCDFCILWKHMGESVNGNGQVRPCWRTKSARRSFEEVQRLYHEFGRRTFGWVDPTFNVSSEWSDEWAELMLNSKLNTREGAATLHTAWLRADGVIRDEKLGVLEKLVRAGLRQVMIGIERDDPEGLVTLNKHNNAPEICREALGILREKYPQVYTIGSMIFGLPGDTRDDLNRLLDCQYDMGMDYCFLIPLTPNPGTALAGRLS
ncbi:MAG: B12-binding domain-containing radical SAM protein, partial [Sedimentisphaerales bacterium]|nr:B12-binding domain-containing radical SAM protein [Sedimentisphaerales bacterium]